MSRSFAHYVEDMLQAVQNIVEFTAGFDKQALLPELLQLKAQSDKSVE